MSSSIHNVIWAKPILNLRCMSQSIGNLDRQNIYLYNYERVPFCIYLFALFILPISSQYIALYSIPIQRIPRTGLDRFFQFSYRRRQVLLSTSIFGF